jgi:hypothetical protein
MSRDFIKNLPPDFHQMEITEDKCRDCNAPLKVAIGIMGGSFYGPERFDAKEIAFARSKGVRLEEKYSRTMDETYLANSCPKCSSFIGAFFVHDYLYAGTMYDISKL